MSLTNLPPIPDLKQELERLLRQLPAERVTTYGTMAKALGNSAAAKWIAKRLSAQPHTVEFPASRVIRSDGSLGNYKARSTCEQARQLMSDGIAVQDLKVDLSKYGFFDFRCSAPLTVLMNWQIAAAKCVALQTPDTIWFHEPADSDLEAVPTFSPALNLLAGIDVSYKDESHAIAVVTVVETASRKLLWWKSHEVQVQFPYISGYLAFRELPVMLPLIQELRKSKRLPEVLLVDGQGTLHPRGFGIAAHLGIITGLSTIGVGKTLPCGSTDLKEFQPGEIRSIEFQGRIIGNVLRSFQTTQLLYISPGHRMDLTTATSLVRWLSREHRLPTPLYWADRLSRHIALGKIPCEEKSRTDSREPQ